jgi:hypothetical protein
VPEARHLALFIEHAIVTIGLDLGDDQPYRIGADVDRAEPDRGGGHRA